MTATPFRVRAIQFTPQKEKEWTVQGWRGMRDSRSKRAEREDQATILVNLRPVERVDGGSAILRTGMKRVTTPTTTQIPTLAEPQWMGSFQPVGGGSDLMVLVAGGEIYTLSITGVLTKVITTAQLTAAAITLHATLSVYCCEYNQTLVVMDGTNVPFTWNGTSGAGLTKLTNVPGSLWGGPTVYYAKLFFIKGDRKTIIWSEENQPNTGYEAGGFNNAWALTQTSAAGLNAVLGTNDGIYYFRDTSVGVIRGAVSTSFQTDGVHDSVSPHHGSQRLTMPLWYGGAVWWLGGGGNPLAFRPGMAEPADIGLLLSRRWGAVGSSQDRLVYGSLGEHQLSGDWNHILGYPGGNTVRIEGASVSSSNRRAALLIDADTYEPIGYDAYQYPGAPTNPAETNRGKVWSAFWPITSASYSLLYADSVGYLFKEEGVGSAGGNTWGFDEVHNGAGAPVTGTVLGPMHGHSAKVEWHFTRLDVLVDALANNSVQVGYLTSRQHKDNLAPAPGAYADAVGADTPYERPLSFGLGASGRWCRPWIQVSGEATNWSQPQIHGYTLTGVPVSSGAKVT